MRRVILAAVLSAVCGGGCGSGPTTPFSPSVGAAGDSRGPAGSWRLTTTLTSVAGPPVCFDGRESVGAKSDWMLDVGRDGDRITLLYDVRNPPRDHLELVGTMQEDRFEASTSWTASQLCADTTVDYQFESFVSGALSEDGRTLTASERWTFRLGPDETVVLWFAWEAQR